MSKYRKNMNSMQNRKITKLPSFLADTSDCYFLTSYSLGRAGTPGWGSLPSAVMELPRSLRGGQPH